MASTTSNLKLNILESGDYISTTPFNDNARKLDALGVDYIIGYKNDSNERWGRAWASGRLECGVLNATSGLNVDIDQTYGSSQYYSVGLNLNNSILGPFLMPDGISGFISVPYTNISVLSTDGGKWAAYVVPHPNATKDKWPAFYLTSVNGQKMQVGHPYYSAIAIGRWK